MGTKPDEHVKDGENWMGTAKKFTADVQSMADSIVRSGNADFISMTNIFETKAGDFFISDWLCHSTTCESPAMQGSVFNYGEFAIKKRKAGISSHDFHPDIFFKFEMWFMQKFKPVDFERFRTGTEGQA